MKKILSEEDVVRFGVPGPFTTLPETISKSDVLRWEAELKQALRRIIKSPDSAFQDIRKLLESRSIQKVSHSRFRDDKDRIFHLVVDLHSQDALPALIFHYDTRGCEDIVQLIFVRLVEAEKEWKDSSSEWAQKIQDFEAWKRAGSIQQKRKTVQRNRGDDGGDSRMSKQEQLREEASVETSIWASFKPNAPLDRFSFADTTKMQASEASDVIRPLRGQVDHWLLDALQRGLGVHHSSLNREYRQA